LYTNNPSFNDRKVYKLDANEEDFLPTCLYWACSTWRINFCSSINEESQCKFSVIYSSETSKKCVHGGDLVWTLYDSFHSTLREDPTMKISCNTDSPTSMTTTPAPGTTTPTTLTYCGSDGIPALNTVTKRRRVGSGLECQEYCAGIQGAEYFKWKKIGAKVCWCIKLGIKPRDNFEGGYVTCDSKLKAHQGAERDCGSDGISALNTVAKKKRVESGLECQEYCAGIQGAEYFKRKKTGAKVCWCIKLGIKARNNFESGPVTC